MSDPRDPTRIQGEDPKAKVFSDLYPVLYAAETPVSYSYEQSSLASAIYADGLAPRGLRCARVIDLGCGYGTTTAALARLNPQLIVALDNSAPMTELMRVVMLGDENLDAWLKSQGAEEALQDLYPGTLRHLEVRRAEFRSGVFSRGGSRLQIRTLGWFDVAGAALEDFDAVVANNVFHWPVNQQKAAMRKERPETSEEELTDQAVVAGLEILNQLLIRGGVAVLMEPDDFVTIDNEPAWKADLEAHAMVNHPAFVGFNRIFNRILKEEFRIERAVPKTTGLFPISKLHGWCETAGLELVRFGYRENLISADLITWCYVRLPLWLGNITIPFENKLSIGRRVVEEARQTFGTREFSTPMHSQSFWLCLRKP